MTNAKQDVASQTAALHRQPYEAMLRTVLVVDDSRVQRRILVALLRRWGYPVLEASSGAEALDICRNTDIDMVLSDWMMPGMSGLEFCNEFRALDRDDYGYFILLTSRNDKEDVARGLKIGADDFLTKPVNPGELRARIAAGERILGMQAEVNKKNRMLRETVDELQALHASLNRDLIEARNLQQSLVPDRFRDFESARLSLLLHPSGHVGGDLVGAFRAGPDRIGVYSIDVSGHGIASALITARLAGYLSGASPDQNVALTASAHEGYQMRSPASVCATLNSILLEEMETEHYFTMLIADCDLRTGRILMSQAGHPYPVVQRGSGEVSLIGDGGLPIGLIAGAEYSVTELALCPGDRVLFYSDGVTECSGPTREEFGEEGLIDMVTANAQISGEKFLETLMWDLSQFSGGENFSDDISGALLEFVGTGSRE